MIDIIIAVILKLSILRPVGHYDKKRPYPHTPQNERVAKPDPLQNKGSHGGCKTRPPSKHRGANNDPSKQRGCLEKMSISIGYRIFE